MIINTANNRNIEIKHDPSNNDPSHSGIYNLKQNDVSIARLILETIRDSDTYPACKD